MPRWPTLTVTGGSSIDGNTASDVSSPAFALTLWARGWFARQSIDARALRNRDSAMIEDKKTLRPPAHPLAGRRMSLRV